MTRMELLRELREVMKDPTRTGDVAVLKSELGGTRAFPEFEALLDGVRGYHPPIDPAALSRLPAGSFGHEYARFMATNSLTPLAISDKLDPELVRRNAFNARYAVTHDMFHVLTGFDASPTGEAAVWAFVRGQGYSSQFNFAALMALVVFSMLPPWRALETWRSWRRALAMGERAEPVLAMRLEDHFERPLVELRAELGIVGATDGYVLS